MEVEVEEEYAFQGNNISLSEAPLMPSRIQ